MSFFKKKPIILQINVIDQIDNKLLNMRLPDNLNIIKTENHVFPDGFLEEARDYERMYYLSNKNNNLAIFKVSFNYLREKKTIEPTIKLNFVQGIKQDKKIDMPKKWPEIIVDAFLYSSVPLTIEHPEIKIRYDELIPFVGGGDRNIHRKKTLIELKEQRDRLINEKKLTEKQLTRVKYLNEIITAQENKLRIINALRDRYFNNDGYLNFNKKRIKHIYSHSYNNLRVKISNLKPILSKIKEHKISNKKIKKNFNKKKMNIKRVIR